MDEKLKLAADKIEIADVVYKYCRAIDRMDPVSYTHLRAHETV